MHHTTTGLQRKAGGTITIRLSRTQQERARDLDYLADRELSVGRHAQAERLSHLAASLREVRS